MKRLGMISGLTVGLLAPVAYADTYELDPVHSTVIVKAGHMGISASYARFNEISGTLVVDEADAKKNGIEVVIKSQSFDSNSQKRDDHVRGPDFLNAKQFPEIKFKSTSFTKQGGVFKIAGDLTLHGVTKPINMEVKEIGRGKDPWGGFRIGGEGTLKIKRSDYGIKYMPEGVSDELDMIIALEGLKKDKKDDKKAAEEKK